MNLIENENNLEIKLPCISVVAEKTPKKKPLVVILHGYGKSPDIYSILPPKINENDFNYIIPSAPFRFMNEGELGYGWLMTKLGGDDLYGRKLSEKYILDTIKAFREKNNLIGDIYLMAFSQASYLAACLSIKYPNIFSKTVITGGWANEKILNKMMADGVDGHDFFIQHGNKDSAVPLEYGKKLAKYFSENEGNVIFKEYNCGHEYTNEILQDVNLYLKEDKIEGCVKY